MVHQLGLRGGGGFTEKEPMRRLQNPPAPFFQRTPAFSVADFTIPVRATLECTITELIQTSKSVKSICAL